MLANLLAGIRTIVFVPLFVLYSMFLAAIVVVVG